MLAIRSEQVTLSSCLLSHHDCPWSCLLLMTTADSSVITCDHLGPSPVHTVTPDTVLLQSNLGCFSSQFPLLKMGVSKHSLCASHPLTLDHS